MLACLLAILELTIPEILSGNYDFKPAHLTGQVVDVLDDETDPEHVFFTVRQGDDIILVSVNHAKDRYDELRRLVGATVRFAGESDASIQYEMRRHMGRRFNVQGCSNIVEVAAGPDLFDAPDVLELDALRPAEISRSRRHRTTGRTLATWDGDKALIMTPANRLIRLDFADPGLPSAGTAIEAVGFPETDLYHLNLSRAIWRAADMPTLPHESVRDATVRELFEDLPSGKPIFQEKLYGHTLRLFGTVNDTPRDGVLKLKEDGFDLAVDVSAIGDRLPEGLSSGCRVEVIGTCVMDVDNWRPNAPFPKIRGITLVTRTPADIRVVIRAPWWTPGRLLAVIVGLFGALLAIFIWNVALRKLIERRSRELFREQVAHVSANLRTKERTRLAIELHDSLSQNLTGIAFELKTAETAAPNDLPTALKHLAIAGRSLASCHTELRNCLWDLRNGTLESLDLDDAIRRTLRPQVGDIDLAVRFNVPRRILTDNTAYAILKIVRELAVNAVRHGKATSVKVAGAVEGRRILFSVTDNGCGFDPKAAPGPAEGHYGLLGVTERIEDFTGEMRIDSTPGRGTRVAVALSAPQQKEQYQ